VHACRLHAWTDRDATTTARRTTTDATALLTFSLSEPNVAPVNEGERPAMGYFVTGATGFIGGQLVERLLANRSGTIYCLVREGSEDKLDERIREWGTTKRRVKPVVGDLAEPKLGLTNAAIKDLKGDVDHVFHLAAIYDMTASDEALRAANVEGTRHVVEFVNKVKPRVFHHVLSIAAAGRYQGTFREDMFDEATGLDANPYFATKHESERIARDECEVPWRVYRPGIVIGDSRTGEIDKIDGPYYFFKLVQRLRDMLPQWFPLVGLEGRRINIVPVDFVADALDHIAHLDEDRWDEKVFHLVDEDPYRAGQVINLFAEAAHAPRFQMRIDAAALELIPKNAKKLVGSLPPVRNAKRAVLGDLGIPEDVLGYINWPTKYDRRNTSEALEGTDIEARASRSTRGGSGTTGSATSTRTSTRTAHSRGASAARRCS
jgi:thioester reductase-like protein